MTPSAVSAPIWQGLGRVTEGADAAAGIGTAYDLAVGQTAMGTIANSGDTDWFAVTLQAGVTYDFRLLGYTSALLSDPLLRLMDASGNQIALNDDGFTSYSSTHELDSALSFTAATTGTFYLEAGKFGSVTGTYLLSATQQDAGGPVLTVDEIAWQLINNGMAYFGQAEGSSFDVGFDSTLTVNLTGLTATAQVLAQNALAVWSAYTGILFQQVNTAAELTFDDTSNGAFAQPIFSGSTITSASVNIGTDWLASFGTTLDSYSFETFIHEIGHALGLGHGGNYNGSATFGSDNYYQNDSLAWSIMSYMQAENDEFDDGGASDWNTYVDASFRYMYSPMIADIIAMQQLYGTFTGAATGNTTYGFGSNTGVAALDQAALSGALMAMTIYDTGGRDTLNFSATTEDQYINLSAESLSSVLGGRNNLGIARGVVIEHATGGAGDDELVGNRVGNRLNGGTGSDTLRGGAGNDTYVTNGGDLIVETANKGTDTVISSASHVLVTHVENLTLTGGGAINGTGNTSNNTLRGNNAANVLDGKTGADTLIGGGGDDTYVTDGGDLITEAQNGGTDLVLSSVSHTLRANVENLTLTKTAAINGNGNDLANSLRGNSAANALNGGLGNDTMFGGAGNDSFVFNTALGAGNVDRITDFAVPDDTIRLENAFFLGLANGGLAASAFAANLTGNAADASDRIIYETDTGRLFFDADGVGGAARVQFAILTAGLAMTHQDFIVF